MKANTISTETSSSTLLTGMLLFTNLPTSGLSEYVIRAVVGGAILMGFKVLGDFLSNRVLKNGKQKDKDFPTENQD